MQLMWKMRPMTQIFLNKNLSFTEIRDVEGSERICLDNRCCFLTHQALCYTLVQTKTSLRIALVSKGGDLGTFRSECPFGLTFCRVVLVFSQFCCNITCIPKITAMQNYAIKKLKVYVENRLVAQPETLSVKSFYKKPNLKKQ